MRRCKDSFLERLALAPLLHEVSSEGGIMLDNAGRIIQITRLRCRFPRFDILLLPSNLPDRYTVGSIPAKAMGFLYEV